MNRSLRLTITLLMMAPAVCVLPGCSRNSTIEPDKGAVASLPTSNQDAPKLSTDPAEESGTSEPDDPRDAFETRQLSEADLARTSWENPFRPRLWSSDGWRLDEDSMTSGNATSPPATFLRPYRNVVIECRFSRQGEVIPPDGQSSIEFELRLLNRDTHRWTSLSYASGKVTLSESGNDTLSAQRPLRESKDAANSDTKDLDVRLTMTPNRVLVAVNGQMRINSPRPTSILNAECLPQFVVDQPGVSVTDIRFEGD